MHPSALKTMQSWDWRSPLSGKGQSPSSRKRPRLPSSVMESWGWAGRERTPGGKPSHPPPERDHQAPSQGGDKIRVLVFRTSLSRSGALRAFRASTPETSAGYAGCARAAGVCTRSPGLPGFARSLHFHSGPHAAPGSCGFSPQGFSLTAAPPPRSRDGVGAGK